LEVTSPAVQANAAGVLMNLALTKENKDRLTQAGAIPPLVAFLVEGSDECQANAAAALLNLSFKNPKGQLAISHAGAIEPLVHLLTEGKQDTQANAAAALLNLALGSVQNKKMIA